MTATPLEAVAAGIAPRMEAGWRAMLAVLGDGAWHSHTELTAAAAVSAGELAPRTCQNILADARKRWVVTWEDRSPVLGKYQFWYRQPPATAE